MRESLQGGPSSDQPSRLVYAVSDGPSGPKKGVRHAIARRMQPMEWCAKECDVMDNHKPAAERIRPILEAMERSIDSARRSRMHEPTGASVPQLQQAPVQRITPPPTSEPGQRLKARPKRLAGPLGSAFDQPTYRSQAS